METQRLDVWLDITCLFRTRSEAQKACRMGRVSVNGQPAKPNREVRAGDQIVVSRPFGRKQSLVVRGLAEKHIAKAEARALYEDRTPPPTPEEVEMRRLERLTRTLSGTRPATPDKRERRRIRKLKEGSER
jgi:ribosome-associated heat shock protein Hsp15